MNDTTDPSPSSQSRALDPGNDESDEKDAYLQRRPESGSRRSLCSQIPPFPYLIPRPVCSDGSLPRVVGCPIIQEIVSSDGKSSVPFDVGVAFKTAGSKKLEMGPFGNKFVSLRPLRNSAGNHDQVIELDKFSITWSMGYAVILDRTHTLEIWSQSSLKRWILSTVDEKMNQTAILCRWLETAPRQRIREWEHFLLLALQHSPECALEALDFALSHQSLHVPRHTVNDSLAYLTTIYLERVGSPPSVTVDKIHRITCNLAKRSRLEDRQQTFMRQRTFSWLLHHCHSDQVVSLYEVLRDEKIYLTPYLSLCFLGRFIEMGKTPLSLEVLRNLTTSGMSLNSYQSNFTKQVRMLIRSEDEHSDGKDLYRMRKHILAQILQMGIHPDITAYTAIMQNSVEAEEYDSAVQFYEMARGSGLKPDRVTHVVLLEAAMGHSDYGILDMAVRDVEADRTLYGDEGLIFKLLCAKLKLKKTTAETFFFDAMLQTYKKYCDPCPIQDLGLCESDINPPDTSIHPLISPSPRILSIMLETYIKQHHYSEELFNIYQRYYRFVDERHPLIAAIEESDHVANAFIFAFGQSEQTLQMGINIVRKMLQNSAYSESTDLTTSMAFKFAAPTIYTWTTLAMIYARHGQSKAVEKILEMMRERGLKPDDVVWNSMISGYSALQRINEAVATVKRMEADGFPMDRFTLKGLGRFRNRNRLLHALREGLGIDDVEAEQGR